MGTDLFSKGDGLSFCFVRRDCQLVRSRNTEESVGCYFRWRWPVPRIARVVLPAYPHHVVQRGHNQEVCFADDADYERYLATLAEFKRKLGVKVYAWCLMTNHVHLLLAPSTATSLGLLMQRLSGRQTRYHNRLEQRSGTLWQGRYKSSLVQHEGYLLACCRYIELNPVRARLRQQVAATLHRRVENRRPGRPAKK